MTPDEPPPTPPGDESLDHVMKNLFDSELERIAFARPHNDDERRRAAAAARELARRSANHAARSGETRAPEAGSTPAIRPANRARGAEKRTAGHADARPTWRRTLALVGAGILTVSIAVSVMPGSPTDRGEGSSLDVFTRAASTEELTLQRQLQREGLRLSVAPRIIAQHDGAQILAFRFIITSGAERPRNEVCLLLNDKRALGSPQCIERVDFLRDGMLASLAGSAATYVVRWGPSGTAEVSVLPQNQVAVEIPDSRAAEALLTGEQTADDLAYSELLRALHPDDRMTARVLSSTPEWDAVGTLIASADTGLWSYCVHLFARADDARAQLGASVTCAGREQFERDGLIAQARSAESTLLVEWRPDDTVIVRELGGP